MTRAQDTSPLADRVWVALLKAGPDGVADSELACRVYGDDAPLHGEASVRCQVQRLRTRGFPIETVKRGKTLFRRRASVRGRV